MYTPLTPSPFNYLNEFFYGVGYDQGRTYVGKGSEDERSSVLCHVLSRTSSDPTLRGRACQD